MPLSTTEPSTDHPVNVIRGTIFDAELKDPLIGASIGFVGTHYGTVTDLDGKFLMVVPDSILASKMILSVSYTGYTAMLIDISKAELPLQKDIYLEMNWSTYGMTGAMVIMKKRKWWQVWKPKYVHYREFKSLSGL